MEDERKNQEFRKYKKIKKKRKKYKIKKKRLLMTIIIILIFVFIINIIKKSNHSETVQTVTSEKSPEIQIDEKEEEVENEVKIEKKEITDWRLRVANYENILPEDFSVKVKNIDKTRQFDERAIDDLTQMMNDMKKNGITNIWIQSAYRSVERQKELYDNSVQKYLKQGLTQEKAEELTNEYINKPGSSDHNLGLAVDFNYVDNKFEKLQGFKWLQENAENYGFILRYPKDKEEITNIAYESWHWRYVGEEHAKKMNELNMCLEEYVEYLSEQ